MVEANQIPLVENQADLSAIRSGPVRLHASTATFVEVSADELIRMDKKCEPLMKESGLLKVGWFHTHPGHGIFMSQTDKDNHAMYTKPWQVALVLDPVRKTFGFFSGQHCDRILHLEQLRESGESPPPATHHLPPTDIQQPNSPRSKKRPWILLGIVLNLGLLYSAVTAYWKADSALRRLADEDKRINRIENELMSVREHGQTTTPKPDLKTE